MGVSGGEGAQEEGLERALEWREDGGGGGGGSGWDACELLSRSRSSSMSSGSNWA